MPTEHKHFARHTENTQQMLAKSIWKALNKKPVNAVIMIGHCLLFGLAKKKTESESESD